MPTASAPSIVSDRDVHRLAIVLAGAAVAAERTASFHASAVLTGLVRGLEAFLTEFAAARAADDADHAEWHRADMEAAARAAALDHVWQPSAERAADRAA